MFCTLSEELVATVDSGPTIAKWRIATYCLTSLAPTRG